MEINAQAIEKLIDIHFEETKHVNSTGNRMFLLGVVSTAQFCNDQKIQQLVREVINYLDSTRPTTIFD